MLTFTYFLLQYGYYTPLCERVIMTINCEKYLHILENPEYKNKSEIKKLKNDFHIVKKSIEKIIKDKNYKNFVDSITEYDEFIWNKANEPESKSKPITYKKWKIYSSYIEMIWSVVFHNVSEMIKINSKCILTDRVLEGATENGFVYKKDVDGGIGIGGKIHDKEIIFPLCVMEHKSGHFCKTQCTNVNSIMRRFKDTNKKIATISITENHVTIGKTENYGLISDIDILIIERGKCYGKYVRNYNKINHEEMKKLQDTLINYFKKFNDKDFLEINLKKSSKFLIRENLEKENSIFKI